MTGFAPTAQQQTNIDAALRGESFVAAARAGAGKTTTALAVAKALIAQNPNIRILYVAFNKSTQVEAAAKFPAQVTCKTTHSLAWSIGAKMRNRMTKPMGTASRVQMWKAAQQFGVSDVTLGDVELNAAQVLRIAVAAVAKFSRSNDQLITAYHVNRQHGLEDNHDELVSIVLPLAKEVWKDVKNGHILNVQGEHYIKIWALSQPKLPYDVIIYDEAQDANGAMYGVIKAHMDRGGQAIFVGDPEQAINGWNGAIDVIKLSGLQMYPLSKSFRFGQAVADKGNFFLKMLGVPDDTLMTGFEQINSVTGQVDNPDAILCRTNAGVIQVAMRELATGKRVGIVGGGESIKELATAALQLRAGQKSTHPDLFTFKSWSEVVSYAREDEGKDLLPFVLLVGEQAENAELVIDAMNKLTNEKYADVVISTGHKAKGREWKRVVLHTDFALKVDEATGQPKLPNREGLMLLYVAVTRAQLELDDTALADFYKLAA